MKLRKPRRPQLRTRVLAGVLAVTVVSLAAFDIAAITGLRRYLVSHTDARLGTVLSLYRPQQVHVQAVRVGPPPGRLPVGMPWKVVIAGPRVQVPSILGQYNVSWLPAPGQVRTFVKGPPDLVPRLPAGLPVLAADHASLTVVSRNGQAQLRVRAIREGGGTLVAAASLSDVNSTMGQLELIVIVGSLAAALLVAVGVGLIMRRGLRPIEMMASEADRITAGDLTARVSPHGSATEVGRLGTALNGMLTRIEANIHEREASQEATRRFFADASHELRNPLASLRANAELYQQGALPRRPQVDEAMRRIALEAQRMSGLVDDMLRLARLDQYPGQDHDPVDLTTLASECASRAQIADTRRTWLTRIDTGLTTTGDKELLRRAIDNLLTNVRCHTPGGSTATITAARHNGSVVVEVSDDGPGVPPGQLPRIFDRFYRGAAQPAGPGSGLGLAIVTAIASAHEGTAEATLNQPHGLRVTLTLPASAPSAGTGAAARPGAGLPAASGTGHR